MITNISIVSVFVKDVDESKRFYTDVLGFDAKDDITLAGGYRWCTVVHPNQPELMVNLNVPGPPHPPQLVEAMSRCYVPSSTSATSVIFLSDQAIHRHSCFPIIKLDGWRRYQV